MKTKPDPVDHIISTWGDVSPDLDVTPMHVFGRLHRAYLLYRQEITALFEELGTSTSGFEVLAALRRQPEFRAAAGDLAQGTLVTTGGLTLRVRRLEAEGLVTRSRDTRDNRVVYVELTEMGLELVDRVARIHFANLGRLLDSLSERERSSLAGGLNKLEQSMTSATGAAPSE
ncbi:MarR family winged helix-turn-helix transcriptional regulator [Janibacter cremeus]|uniref:DNA-binding MarR family transcriptional regulator n=1 Tax=Janibacter cremeus TaxID=1285192 RepID=A0A852VWA5_9MICO|nr:MarR family transcriptional regulator [Janibacter cremeus]NYF98055.1 DNA-binding MarR family transcriptional regulator [Janibacter cremeus]